jgi:hypothetical protein
VIRQSDLEHPDSRYKRYFCGRPRRDPMAKRGGESAEKTVRDIRQWLSREGRRLVPLLGICQAEELRAEEVSST